MPLWNDYEGKTIAGVFPVGKLIRPEGRSAFFTTSNGSGKPAVLRLIESIHDETEILDRWNTVADLKQTHLITFKQYGQTVLEGIPLIYAVMEPSEADLAEILLDRSLTSDETRQIATSLVQALQSLHSAGLIHEHIEPANVLATSDGTQDIVKLRSDCVREAPHDPEAPEDPAIADALRTRDVHDLAVVLLQALTQSRTLVANGHTLLPKPFDQIIRNGINGTWTLNQIATALNPPAPVGAASAPARPQYTAPAKKPQGKASNPDQATLPLEGLAGSLPAGLSQPDHSPAAVAASFPATVRIPTPRPASAALDRIRLSLEADPKRKRLWLASAAGILVVIATLGWYSLRSTPDRPITPISEMTPTPATPSKPSATKPAAGILAKTNPSARQKTTPADKLDQTVQPAQSGQPLAIPDGHPQWRVVAFTYNHEDQAWQKAAALGREHSFLRPEVFTPTGHAPFLVTVGGAMTREQAFAFRDKARNAGLPHDLYAQNYTGRSR